MSDKKKDPIESLGLDEALADLKFLAQKVSDMSKDLAKKAVDNAEGVTDKVGDIVEIRKSNRIDLAPNGNVSAAAYKIFKQAMNGDRVLAMIMETKALPMSRAIAGGKIYKILPTKTGVPLYAAEKDLKKTRRTKK